MDKFFFYRTLESRYITVPVRNKFPIKINGHIVKLNGVGHIAVLLILRGHSSIEFDYLENVCPVIETLPLVQQLEILDVKKYLLRKHYSYVYNNLDDFINDENLTIEATLELYNAYTEMLV